MFAHVSVQGENGELTEPRMAVVSCPACSYFRDGSCVVCEDDSEHPACDGCAGGTLVWYRSPVIAAVGSAVVVSIITTMILSRLSRTKAMKRFL